MSYDIATEPVPQFLRRIGDHVIQGSNNTIIILGTDRVAPLGAPATIAQGFGSAANPTTRGTGAGSIHIIAGRNSPTGDPSLGIDDATIYLSRLTTADSALGTSTVGTTGVPPFIGPPNVAGDSAAVIVSDEVRIVCRKDLKICDATGTSWIALSALGIEIEGPAIRLGAGAIAALGSLLKGGAFATIFDAHTHPIVGSSTGPPVAGISAAESAAPGSVLSAAVSTA